ncbi:MULTISPECIES: hypothetical protein [unclassified Polaromonas]|jgi:hypothetical protein|uniref:hypothetical protein n=1 Tax=unclassified Polaromonas TaxID=2638319 RepID=UPI000BD08053|nr:MULTISPECIES: hypothetical protein [unclassified Polaromonas]OYY36381.1 MAG: hypothetical protein B7Y60_09325 [Polaromonas sp. 35-63-35]OYZ22616.1 MAG: hypothetical protein B7Y28_01475 [Polaromonas sp. 16-63-31]OYZ81168.1 MAG: hypothetical protein B7Y09_01680 [Polaromonas sp. 24-63-21]OZA52610.1 MAG: hypothetical protein B7X88_01470 [Polaromonas sp. 17-63-33]OZA88531.1 MAG: hypothetical protein B7X65_08155 [Polaromonas sp. 39-63-25]
MEATAWTEIMSALDAQSVETCVAAAERLHAEADADDVPKLLALLETGDFFAREAAAWPLAELAGPTVLAELLKAYQRGFDEGHDNDGFTAALLEIPALFPDQVRASLASYIATAVEPARGHALWLLEFCQGEAKQ